MTTGIRFELDIPIGPDWKNVELLRSSVLSCLAAIFQSQDFCVTVGMIAGELIENAIKYGDWTRGDRSRFKLNVRGDDRSVALQVMNPVAPDGGEEVLRMVRWIASFPSPAEAYRARLRELADAKEEAPRGGLGLARIAYEGECQLAADLRGGVLSLEARLGV